MLGWRHRLLVGQRGVVRWGIKLQHWRGLGEGGRGGRVAVGLQGVGKTIQLTHSTPIIINGNIRGHNSGGGERLFIPLQ